MIDQDRPIEDETIAGRTDLPILITAFTRREIERVARRIHLAGDRAAAPFVPIRIGELPAKSNGLKQQLADLFDAAAGGTLLLTMAEDMSPGVQHALVELLDDRRRAGTAASAARLISGTTVSLVDRVTVGAFSNRLFYRLNSIHLVAPGPRRFTVPSWPSPTS